MSDDHSTEQDVEKQRELQQLLEGEGYTPDVAAEITAGFFLEQNRHRVDQEIERLREQAAKRPPPAPAGTIDLRTAKRRRQAIEDDASEAQWDDFQSTLINLLETSPLYSIETVTITALLMAMQGRDNIEPMAAIEIVEKHLRIIRDVEQGRLNRLARGIEPEGKR